ncbi:MAG TPA: hypothetical protein PKN54_07675 [Candidatus Cloacimonas acidaminovorans]|nr:hypothetical protein [Candidatus Cloacimonas acidaminovorans]
MGFVANRFESAERITMAAVHRYYETNLYKPLERLVTQPKKVSAWDKLMDKRKIKAFYDKMNTAKKKGGDNNFSKLMVQDKQFVIALDTFDLIIREPTKENLKLVRLNILPFLKDCEMAEIGSKTFNELTERFKELK